MRQSAPQAMKIPAFFVCERSLFSGQGMRPKCQSPEIQNEPKLIAAMYVGD